MSNTITAVQNNGTYEGSYGTMYKQEVTLDDGSTGEVSAKTADKWKVGDVVEVQRTETQYGTRFKFSIPQTGGQGGFKSGGNFQNMGEAAEALDLSRKTVDTWRSRPERMLKHVFLVREVTGASAAEIMDVIEETRRSSHYEE